MEIGAEVAKKAGMVTCHCLNCARWERLTDDRYVGWCYAHNHWCLQLERCQNDVPGEERMECRSDSGNYTNHKIKEQK